MIESVPETILYVDDDPEDQEFFVSCLSVSRPDTHCYIAIDGQTALEMVSAIPVPRYIFIDLQLPRMNGIELLKQIKAIPAYSSVPCYILSTSLYEPYERLIMEIGGNGFLRKPASFEEFKIMFDNVFR